MKHINQLLNENISTFLLFIYFYRYLAFIINTM
jgi:hypothetical protein